MSQLTYSVTEICVCDMEHLLHALVLGLLKHLQALYTLWLLLAAINICPYRFCKWAA